MSCPIVSKLIIAAPGCNCVSALRSLVWLTGLLALRYHKRSYQRCVDKLVNDGIPLKCSCVEIELGAWLVATYLPEITCLYVFCVHRDFSPGLKYVNLVLAPRIWPPVALQLACAHPCLRMFVRSLSAD